MKTAEEWANRIVEEIHAGALRVHAVELVENIQYDARKDLEQELQRLRSDISTTESALGISGIYAKLEQERDQLRQELQAAKCAPPKSFLSAPDSIIMKCGHNSYWKTHYENCMACRAEKAEQQVEAQSNLVCNIQDTCRSRGFMQRPVDEAVIALAQERDTLQRSNAELKEGWKKSVQQKQEQLKQIAELAGQVARLREASIGVVTHKTSSFSKPIEKHLSALEVAISLTPSDALKPILECLSGIIGRLDGYDLNFCFGENNETNQMIHQARAILKQYGHEKTP